jgi:CheY-like chemotaxis protein
MIYRAILVVEDDPILRRVIRLNLASRGHEVREAATAGEAVAAVRAGRPDLMLLDINLPDRTGWDVLRELKRDAPDLPTIVVSAVRIGRSRLDEFHPLAYLPKPFPLDALLRLVGEPTPDEEELKGD